MGGGVHGRRRDAEAGDSLPECPCATTNPPRSTGGHAASTSSNQSRMAGIVASATLRSTVWTLGPDATSGSAVSCAYRTFSATAYGACASRVAECRGYLKRTGSMFGGGVVHIGAPGTQILSQADGDQYMASTGTSM